MTEEKETATSHVADMIKITLEGLSLAIDTGSINTPEWDLHRAILENCLDYLERRDHGTAKEEMNDRSLG